MGSDGRNQESEERRTKSEEVPERWPKGMQRLSYFLTTMKLMQECKPHSGNMMVEKLAKQKTQPRSGEIMVCGAKVIGARGQATKERHPGLGKVDESPSAQEFSKERLDGIGRKKPRK